MKIDWKRKLSSRKFWALIAGFVTGLIVFIVSPERSPEAIGGLVVTFGAIVSYIIGEGLADSATTINYQREDEQSD